MKVHFLDKSDDYWKLLDVLLQLRQQYDRQTLSEQIEKQKAHGYNVVYVKSDHIILAAAGFVVSEKLAWGKHIYIDDLVTNQDHRSTGVGAFLVAWFKAHCQQLGCEQLHLDSGIQKFPAHRFYLRERFNIASHHFSITDLNS